MPVEGGDDIDCVLSRHHFDNVRDCLRVLTPFYKILIHNILCLILFKGLCSKQWSFVNPNVNVAYGSYYYLHKYRL